MIPQNLLTDIGFSPDDIKSYHHYKSIISDKIEEYAKNYMNSDDKISDTLEKVSLLSNDNIHKFTAYLLFILECTGYLAAIYKENNISSHIFVDTMKDIKYKLDECRKVYGVFGTFVQNWYEGFLRMTRFAIGRLQFDLRTHMGDSVDIMGHTLKNGDFYLSCHIPSSGPLLPELVEDSFKKAYDMYKDRLSGKMLFVKCESYLLYPPYECVFGTDSNTISFAKLFYITEAVQQQGFGDCWRIFGEDYKGSTKGFKSETSLQRRFVSYIDNGGTFGMGVGYALYDGEKIITKR